MTKVCECSRRSCRTVVAIHHDDYQRLSGPGRRVVSAEHRDQADHVVRELFDGRTLVVSNTRPGLSSVLCPGCGERRLVQERQARRVRRDRTKCISCARRERGGGWAHRPQPWMTADEKRTPRQTWARLSARDRREIGRALASLPIDLPIERRKAA